MLDKLLQEIIIVVVGKSAEEIVPLLNTPKYVNEFNIAKKLEITINQTRNILYKISDHGLVSSIRKKDKKKGWYTYFWKFEILKCLEFLKNLLIERKEELEKEILERKSKIFYVCEPCGLEYGEDKALLMDFSCDECGEIFTTKDNSKFVKDLNRNLLKVEEKLGLVEEEIGKERVKLDKKKAIRLKKEEKEKLEKKEEARLKRAEKKRELAKEKGIVVKKKIVKKKVVRRSTSHKVSGAKKKAAKKKVAAPKGVPPKFKVGIKKKVVKKIVKKKVVRRSTSHKVSGAKKKVAAPKGVPPKFKVGSKKKVVKKK